MCMNFRFNFFYDKDVLLPRSDELIIHRRRRAAEGATIEMCTSNSSPRNKTTVVPYSCTWWPFEKLKIVSEEARICGRH